MNWNRTVLSILIAAAGCLTEARAADNLLSNDGFESPSIGASTESDTVPSGWTVSSTPNGNGTFGLSAKMARTGKQSVRVTVQGVPESHQGLFQTLPVTAGATYTFGVYIRNDKANPLKGQSCGQILIQWLDVRDQPLAPVGGPTWNSALFAAHWAKFEVNGKAPENAAKAQFVIIEFDGKDAGGGGSFLADDASVTQQ